MPQKVHRRSSRGPQKSIQKVPSKALRRSFRKPPKVWRRSCMMDGYQSTVTMTSRQIFGECKLGKALVRYKSMWPPQGQTFEADLVKTSSASIRQREFSSKTHIHNFGESCSKPVSSQPPMTTINTFRHYAVIPKNGFQHYHLIYDALRYFVWYHSINNCQ